MRIALALARSALRADAVRLAVATVAIAAVVAATALLAAVAAEVERSFAPAPDARDLIVLGRGAATEATSVVPWGVAAALRDLPELATDAHGRPLVSAELVVEPLARTRQRLADGGGWRSIVVRGVEPGPALALRPGARLLRGRWPRRASDEAVVGAALVSRLEGAQPGERIELGLRSWRVVGIMEGGGRALASEVWVPRAQLASDAHRAGLVSSVRLRASSPAAARAIARRIEARPALGLAVVPLTRYAAREARSARLFRGLAFAVALLAGIASAAGTANVFYASVDSRRREVAALRALGAPTRAIVCSVMLEAAAVAAGGFALGAATALVAARRGSLAVGSVAAAATSLAPPAGRFSVTAAELAPAAALVLLACAIGAAGPAARAARSPSPRLLRGA